MAMTEIGKVVTDVSVIPGDKGYFEVAEGLKASCESDVVYFDVKSPMGQEIAAVIFESKISAKKVNLVYKQNSLGYCLLFSATYT